MTCLICSIPRGGAIGVQGAMNPNNLGKAPDPVIGAQNHNLDPPIFFHGAPIVYRNSGRFQYLTSEPMSAVCPVHTRKRRIWKIKQGPNAAIIGQNTPHCSIKIGPCLPPGVPPSGEFLYGAHRNLNFLYLNSFRTWGSKSGAQKKPQIPSQGSRQGVKKYN